MRIPFLILCLVVVYGACQTDSAENVDVAKKIQHNEDYQVDYANIPSEKFLARHKRTILLTKLIKTKLPEFYNSIIAIFMNILKPINALIGQFPIESLSQFFQTIISCIGQVIGKISGILLEKVINLSVQFVKYIFLPGLHTTLNALKKTGFLPPQIVVMVDTFNAIYKILQIMGYLP